MGPFVRLCQLSGFIPFRMEIDPLTKTFRRFNFSLCHPLTWWFVGVKMACSTSFVFSAQLVQSLLLEIQADEAYRLKICLCCQEIFEMTCLTLIQLSLFRCSHLRKAAELIRKADETLQCVSNAALQRDTVTRRIIVGVLFTLCQVKSIN